MPIATPAVLHVFEPAEGGVPAYVSALSRRLSEHTSVGVAAPGAALAAYDFGSAHAHPLRLAKALHPGRDGSAALRLAAIARRTGAEVLHAHSSKAGCVAAAAGRLAGVPSVYTPHGWSFVRLGSESVRRAFASVERIACTAGHSRIVAVCGAERQAAIDRAVAPAGRIDVVRTGIPPLGAGLDRSAARAVLGLRQDAVVIAWVGRRAPAKRPQDLAAIATRLEAPAQLVALGTGLPGSPEAAALVAAGGIVAPAGTAPQTLYAAADIFLQTSGWEAFPLSVLEAMAGRLPVVAYAVGGVPEQVRPGVTGILVPPGDVDAAAAALAELTRDNRLRAALGHAAAEHAAHFSHDRMVTDLLAIYRRTARRAHPASLHPIGT